MCIILGQLSPRFLTEDNWIRLARTASIPLVLALGETFIILLGSIDLSIEGVLAFSSVIVSLTVLNNHNDNNVGLAGAVLLALGTGGLMGFLNGVIHVRLRIPSFMVTLGMGFVGVGLATVLIGGIMVRIVDQSVRSLALDRFWNFPYSVWIALGMFVVAYIIQRFTKLGRYAYAIGGGEDLAKLSGMQVDRYKIAIFTLAGVLYGLGGLLAAAQLGQGNAVIGQGRLFGTITAIVVGGTALSGGLGGVLNTFIGVLIVVVLDNGLVLMGVSPYYQQAVQGVLIVVAVGLSLDRSQLKIVK